MNKVEKEILKEIVGHPSGLLFPASLPGIAKDNQKDFHKLISEKYIEEIPISIPSGKIVTHYRATEKGYAVFDPWYKKAWLLIKGDLRTITVATIVSVVTTLITLVLNSFFNNR